MRVYALSDCNMWILCHLQDFQWKCDCVYIFDVLSIRKNGNDACIVLYIILIWRDIMSQVDVLSWIFNGYGLVLPVWM